MGLIPQVWTRLGHIRSLKLGIAGIRTVPSLITRRHIPSRRRIREARWCTSAMTEALRAVLHILPEAMRAVLHILPEALRAVLQILPEVL